MKISSIRNKIIINFSASVIILITIGYGVSYALEKQQALQKQIDNIKREEMEIKDQSSKLQSKTEEIKKYRGIWKTLTEEQKDTGGIKMEEINEKLNSLATKYNIYNQAIKVTLPTALKGGIFDRKTLDVVYSEVNLGFTTYSDVDAINFISELLTSLTGRTIVTSFEIKKQKSYSAQDFVDISTNKNLGAMNCKIDFYWYAFKEKPQITKAQ